MNYARKTPTMQCSKKRLLVVLVTFSIDQRVFCDLQEFSQMSFQTLNLTGAHVIWPLMLIIMYIQIIVVCYTLIGFFCWKYFDHQLKSSFSKMTYRALRHTASDESYHSYVLFEIDFIYSSKESANKEAECIFCNENSPKMNEEKFGLSVSTVLCWRT